MGAVSNRVSAWDEKAVEGLTSRRVEGELGGHGHTGAAILYL